MRKSVFVFKPPDSVGRDEFVQRMFALGRRTAELELVAECKLTITDADPPKHLVMPFSKKPAAVLSLLSQDGSARPPDTAFLVGAYAVTEAIPVWYDKTWPDGERTPGPCLLTLFHRRPDIDQRTFLDRWHNGHTPLSLKLHPLWNYNRNVVESYLDPGSADYDGIVEEHFREDRDLLNVFRFFGPPYITLVNMLRVYMDVRRFLHFSRVETYFASEFIFKFRAPGTILMGGPL